MTEINPHFGANRLAAIDVAKFTEEIYVNTRGGIKFRQRLRPYICPFHILVDYIPPNANILDVGCGAGLFILLLERLGRISSAIGFDSDPAAIGAAQAIARTLPASARVRFEHRDASRAWPEGRFDVVSLIDVLHHVRPEKQAELIATAAGHVKEGGILLYKDMARRPVWRAWANRLHDLLTVREWIYYAKMEDVVAWARAEDLNLEGNCSTNMLWYGHEWCAFRRLGRTR